MNKEELLKSLTECDTGDEERDHITADGLLLHYINDKDITLAFHNIPKWYA